MSKPGRLRVTAHTAGEPHGHRVGIVVAAVGSENAQTRPALFLFLLGFKI